MTFMTSMRKNGAHPSARRSRPGRAILLAGLTFALASSAAGVAQTPPRTPSTRVDRAQGVQAFETVRQVLQHPRCQNCHIQGDAPLQFDEGRVHAQNVKRGVDGKGVPGLTCGTCHAAANSPASYGTHAPPGAPNWHLPPAAHKMVFLGMSSGAVCRTLKDPAANGGKNLAALVEHVSSDKLVLWGWSPGGGRAPVSISHEDFVSKFKTWVDAGAPCPER
jgi:hypothetical protein